jgi:hypothetical protein
LQSQADSAREVFGAVMPSPRTPGAEVMLMVTPAEILAAMYGEPTLTGSAWLGARAATSQPGRRVLLGQTMPQQLAQQLANSETTRRTAELLRQHVRGATLGAAIEE